jgi:NADH:ubiquinone oxidoreductase subunit
MSYLRFEDRGTSESGKTRRWVVSNALDTGAATPLGWIEWKASWRKYWFCPTNQTGFDAGCLKEIAEFLTFQMENR